MKKIMIQNPILGCCSDLFALLMPLRQSPEDQHSMSDYRHKIMRAFETLDRMAFEQEIGMTQISHVRYAMAAFVDEMVLVSDRSFRLDWMKQPLQVEFFGEHLAGEGFFNRLSLLRQGGEQYVDILELYYVCLQLGFEGIYRKRGIEHLMALQVDLKNQIDLYRKTPSSELSPSGLPKEGLLSTFRRDIPYWAIAAIAGVLVIGIYTGYGVVLHRFADKTGDKVDVMADELGRFSHAHIN